MRRRVLGVLTVLSLVLCVAAGGLWVRSYFRGDAVSFAVGDRGAEASSEWFVHSNYGVLYFGRDHSVPAGYWIKPRPLGWRSDAPQRGWARPHSGRPYFVLGPFSVGRAENPMRRHVGITLPHWAVAAVAAAGPGVWLGRQARRRRRLRERRCVRCGYDLRATAGKCPECGDDVPASG